jgi:hypothetical protein
LGLVRFNDGTDQVFVNGSFSIGHSSNLSDSADGTGGFDLGTSIGVEYRRHAGLITVNAAATWTLAHYLDSRNSPYNYFDPSYSLEFDKETGRTTGALTFTAARASQADAESNVHDVSWNYAAGLNLKYPVIDRYSLSASANYDFLDYTQSSGASLVNLTTYGASLGLFYILDDAHDLFTTYRFRYQMSSDHTSDLDNAIVVGVDGQIIGEINGDLQVGIQRRTPYGQPANGLGQNGGYNDITGSAGLTWHYSRQLAFKLALNKDFNTTSSNATTDNTTAQLNATYDYNAQWHAKAGVGGGETRFLGPFGLIGTTGIERHDYDLTWNLGASYSLNEHLHIDFIYTYLRNWSNLALADFTANTWTLTLSTRW